MQARCWSESTIYSSSGDTATKTTKNSTPATPSKTTCMHIWLSNFVNNSNMENRFNKWNKDCSVSFSVTKTNDVPDLCILQFTSCFLLISSSIKVSFRFLFLSSFRSVECSRNWRSNIVHLIIRQ